MQGVAVEGLLGGGIQRREDVLRPLSLGDHAVACVVLLLEYDLDVEVGAESAFWKLAVLDVERDLVADALDLERPGPAKRHLVDVEGDVELGRVQDERDVEDDAHVEARLGARPQKFGRDGLGRRTRRHAGCVAATG